jgi:hypothetical protein
LLDPFEFLRQYFGGIFYQPFTDTRKEMVNAIEHAAMYGGDQAIAAPRGDGKTRTALFLALKLQLSGAVKFPVIVSKSATRAARELRNLKDAILTSEKLIKDFPEVFEPIVELNGWASRSRQQTAFGQPTRLQWGGSDIVLPTIKTQLLRSNSWTSKVESSARGQIFSSLGIESVRGHSIDNQRPDLIILDDIDDRESARSALQTETNENTIEQDIGGLGGPDRTVARVMLCTKINDTCIAAIFTDRKKKPSWRGRVYKLLDKNPDRMDLWAEYIELRQGRGDDDPDARKAHEFYLENREAMDEGSLVTNPYRFDAKPLEDGEPGQVSALQACFDLIADRGWEHFATEYQNDPPESEKLVTSGLTKELIMSRLSGLDRCQLPPNSKIIAGIDIGKMNCHWVAGAFRRGGAGSILTYGVIEVKGTESTDLADVISKQILRALIEWKVTISRRRSQSGRDF